MDLIKFDDGDGLITHEDVKLYMAFFPARRRRPPGTLPTVHLFGCSSVRLKPQCAVVLPTTQTASTVGIEHLFGCRAPW